MAVDVSTFTSTPTSSADKLVRNDNVNPQEVLVDYSMSEQYHTEPLYLIDEEEIYAYENYKQSEQYSGHGIRQIPALNDATNQTEYYIIEENGKRYASGKTYYLGYQVILVPAI